MASPGTPSTIQFIQAQAFVLSAAGTAVGDTTITLQSFTDIDGNNITNSDLGSYNYGTLEPGNGTQEEAILFTGVTQNANGTATLSGVSSVGFKTPYTVTSGLTKSHAGATKFVLSNDAAFYNNLILYLNSIAGAGAANASTTVKGIVQAATTAQINSGTATGSTGAVLAMTPDAYASSTTNQYVASVLQTAIPYGVATGSSTSYNVALASSLSTLASGSMLSFYAPVSNGTGATLNVNTSGAKSIKKNYNVSLGSGDIMGGQIVTAVYDGTNFQMVAPSVVTYTNGTASKNLADANTTQTIAHGLGVAPKRVYFVARNAGTDSITTADGVFDASNQTCFSTYFDISAASASVNNTAVAGIVLIDTANSVRYSVGTISADATNINIAWVKSASPTGTQTFSWRAEV